MRVIITAKLFDKDGKFIIENTLVGSVENFDKIAIEQTVKEHFEKSEHSVFYEVTNEHRSLYDCKLIKK